MGDTSGNRRTNRERGWIIPAALSLAAVISILLCSGCIPWLRWTADVAVTTSSETFSEMAPDGSGGAFIVWHQGGPGDAYNYAQHIDSAGICKWGSRGVEACTYSSTKLPAKGAADGTGGMVVAWADNRSGNLDIYAQRIDSAGVRAWGDEGIPVCTLADNQRWPEVVTGDSPGQVIVVWRDGTGYEGTGIFAQKIDIDGALQWDEGGVAICDIPGEKKLLQVVPDGSGGAIAAWCDGRYTASAIFAQKMDSNGNVSWSPDGLELATDIQEYDISMAVDGLGGALLAWQNLLPGAEGSYAQRVDCDGHVTWQAGGLSVCNESGKPGSPDIVSDGTGGAIVAWSDARADAGDIYAQKITPDGDYVWDAAGMPVAVAYLGQGMPVAATDGDGGAVIAWTDSRFVVFVPGQPYVHINTDVFVARVDRLGNGAWGMDIAPSVYTQLVNDIVPSNRGGALVGHTADTDIHHMFCTNDISLTRVTNWELSSSNQKQLLDEFRRRTAEYDRQLRDASRGAETR